ncbi:MAG: hypothetical protein HUK26_07875, partial [Duodenibacillus sp.]|nr:hypothetical protein [Duodenibacillus sp.]
MLEKFFQPSLRIKLVLAIALIVSLAGFPLIYIGYKDAYNGAVDVAREHHATLTKMVEDAVELAYLNTQQVPAEKVRIEKDDLVVECDVIERWLKNNDLEDSYRTLAFLESTWDTYTMVIGDWGDFVYVSPLARKLWQSNIVDYVGVPLRDYFFHASDRPQVRHYYNYFTFVTYQDEDGEDKSLLVLVRKVAGHTIAILSDMSYLESYQPEYRKELISHLKDVIASIELNKGATVSVYAGTGGLIAGHDHPDYFKGEMLARTRNEGFVSAVCGDQDEPERLYTARYLKYLDWIIIARQDLQQITKPAHDHAVSLTETIFAIFCVVAVLGLAAISSVLKPLRTLGEVAGKLQKLDFKADDIGERLIALNGLMPRRNKNDEIGSVSRAFGSMVMALDGNISDLKATLARQHGIEGELNAAREIQHNMLMVSEDVYSGRGFRAATLMTPAKEVGGDFYDIIDLDGGRKALILGAVQ